MQNKWKIIETLKPGASIVVSFGKHGEQFACAVARKGYYPNGVKSVGIRIWRAKSQRWTKPRRLEVGEFLRLAVCADEAKFKPDFGPAWGWE